MVCILSAGANSSFLEHGNYMKVLEENVGKLQFRI
jgi:hypothetical protein